jgi:hypothetical protein
VRGGVDRDIPERPDARIERLFRKSDVGERSGITVNIGEDDVREKREGTRNFFI